MKFKFRLDKILELLHLKERELKHRFLIQKKRVVWLEQQVQKLETHIEFALDKTESKLASHWLEYYDQDVPHRIEEQRVLQKQIRDEKFELEKIKKRIELMRLKRKSLEALREKKRGEFRQEVIRDDQKKLDEAFQNFQTAKKTKDVTN